MNAEEKAHKSDPSCSWIRPLLAGSGALIVFVFTGITEAQSAVILPQLEKEDSSIQITPDEGSWIASLGILMSPVSALLCGPFIDSFGRKKGLQVFYLNMGLGFGMIAGAREVWHIYIGRIVCAFGVEEKAHKSDPSCSWIRPLLAGSGALIVFVFTGITEAQSAVILPQLEKEDSSIQITPDEGSWIASLGILMSPVSALLCGPFIDSFGRKKGLQVFYLNMGLGFGMIAGAREVWHIYIGRIVCAFGVGLEVVAVVYLAEISTKEQRSILFSIMAALFSGGVTLTFIIGEFLPWNLASAVFSLTCFLIFIVECFTPESPPWLFKMGQQDNSKKSLEKLGRSKSSISKEIEFFSVSSKDKMKKVNLNQFLEPTVWKPFLILSTFHLLQCATGIYDIIYYTVDFIESLGTSYNALSVSLILSAFRFIANCTIGIYFTTKVSRRFTTIVSGFLMGVSLVGTAVYEYACIDMEVAQKPSQWIPVVLMSIYIVSSAVGVTALPWMMAGEMFPLHVRGAMTGADFVVGSLFMFLTIKVYDIVTEALKIHETLLLIAVPSFAVCFFGMYILTETQNKSLHEIEESFKPKLRKQLSSNFIKAK